MKLTHKDSFIGYSLEMTVFACYCDRRNYNKIAQLCLALDIRFCNYSDEYLIFYEDVTDILKNNDITLEFKIYKENWAQFGDNVLGFNVYCDHIWTEDYDCEKQDHVRTVYHNIRCK